MWYDGFNNVLHQICAQLVDADLLRVLHGDDDGVHTQWNAGAFLHPVLTSHLSTAMSLQNYATTVDTSSNPHVSF